MIQPGPASPFRPIIQAFYNTSNALGKDAKFETYVKTLRRYLKDDGHRVQELSAPLIDMVVDERVGVAVLPLTGMITDLTRERLRNVLATGEYPAVALMAAFRPTPRLARVDAPLEKLREYFPHLNPK
jgi:hypothetical protein